MNRKQRRRYDAAYTKNLHELRQEVDGDIATAWVIYRTQALQLLDLVAAGNVTATHLLSRATEWMKKRDKMPEPALCIGCGALVPPSPPALFIFSRRQSGTHAMVGAFCDECCDSKSHDERLEIGWALLRSALSIETRHLDAANIIDTPGKA